MYKWFTDDQFIKNHPKHGAQYRKPSQYTVVFPVKHIKNTQTARRPKKKILKWKPEDIMPDQLSQDQKPVIDKSNDNAHYNRM